jgi:hypothetical protein|tara:strand:+ start:249 stop:593 length:345 start_codon:yes stop_codon:yes gene_type:complete
MAITHVEVVGDASGAKAQNVEWFAADLSPETLSGDQEASKFRLTIAVSSAVDIECTLDGGSTWLKLNSGNNLVADALYIFDIPTRFGDTYNMRTTNGSGTTVRVCRISEVSMEG